MALRYIEFAKIVVITVFFLIIGTFIAAYVSYILKEKQATADEIKLQALYPNILEGESINPPIVTLNFSKTNKIGSPLIFGGSDAPTSSQQDVWDLLADSGVTSIRKDFFPENALPSKISIEDYKNNVNDIQEPKNWNWNEISKINEMYSNAKQRGLTTFGIVSYAPHWLTYTRTFYGVPKDWEVYKDIIKKMYTIYRENLDYVEIWNEPDHEFFLVTENSGMTKQEAYKMIYKTASEAIREVDIEKNDGKYVKIGGPVESNPRVSDLLAVIATDNSIRYKPDFLSFHTYDSFEESLDKYESIKKNYLNPTTPIFITEWNMHSIFFETKEYKAGDKAILYTADRFLNYFSNDIKGANYFSMKPINIDTGAGENTMGFYKIIDGKIQLLPQAKTWRLLSKQLKLGEGESKIYNPKNVPNNIKMLGFKNINGQYVIVVINDSKSSQVLKLILNETQIKNFAKTQIFHASATNDATMPIYEGLVKKHKKEVHFSFLVPEESVVGLLFTDEKEWYNLLPFTN